LVFVDSEGVVVLVVFVVALTVEVGVVGFCIVVVLTVTVVVGWFTFPSLVELVVPLAFFDFFGVFGVFGDFATVGFVFFVVVEVFFCLDDDVFALSTGLTRPRFPIFSFLPEGK